MSDLKPLPSRMFSTENPKAAKSVAFGYLNAILYLAPHSFAGVGNLCPKASEGCKRACLGLYSGQASMAKGDELNGVRAARVLKAHHFMRNRPAFMRSVMFDLARQHFLARSQGLKLAVRLNGSTDIAYEGLRVELSESDASEIARLSRGGLRPWSGTYRNIFEVFPSVQFLDYTKIATRMRRVLPSNYHLTFSRSEVNDDEARGVLLSGGNVAAVFNRLPIEWNGARVIDGDKHDLRFLDARNVVVGLVPKGHKAKRDNSGFVIHA
jgi:hypothetical protein